MNFLFDADLGKTIDNGDERRKPEPSFLWLELIAKFDNIFIPVYSFYFVIFDQAPQEEPRINVLNIFLINDFFSHFWNQVGQVPALEVR